MNTLYRPPQLSPDEKREASRLCKIAKQKGFRLTRSRQRLHANNHGGFQLVHSDRNEVVAGCDFSLSLDQAKYFLTERF